MRMEIYMNLSQFFPWEIEIKHKLLDEENIMREGLAPSERVRIVINHQEPDRPPIQFYATPEARLSF